ncbi:autotransporter outer membrane beta-barrel domain-containing protein [Rickettsia endosymbiont of Culicoides newsteadi]|uniref:autotransporter outer membrane beta-barrel domain-containing protein n=1 Tax=Rickettsia endosymbiont of Culicoides newsteadi TaxID=1961830 RepID=UPI000B9B3C84|nr:autotransporter outer membrane beta-barrel domain-containing protein [Rickettsia endosymbiont of Culicoides newsteadi]OZG32569.1 outer membrane autotransporter barrel domain-containing protein [Rickettsia endosymbiont of Culicoides newsteadi]
MNKERKKSNFLRSLLATASVASVIVGASSSAFGITPNRVGSEFNDNGHWSEVRVIADDDMIDFDPANPTFNVIANANRRVSFNTNGVVGAQVSVPGNTLTIKNVLGGKTLKILATNDAARIILGMNGTTGNFEVLKNIDLDGRTATVTISGDNFNSDVDFRGGGTGKVVIDSTGVVLRGTWAAGNDSVENLEVNAGKSVTITNNLHLVEDVTLGGAVDTPGSTITFNGNVTAREIKGAYNNTGTVIFAGDSVVTSLIGNAIDAKLHRIEIGGKVEFQNAAVTKATNIVFNGDDSSLQVNNAIEATSITTTKDGTGTLHLNGNIAHNIAYSIGTKENRLKELKFTNILAATAVRVHTEAFIDAFSVDGGIVTFDHELNVDTTNLTGPNVTTLILTKGGNLGRVDFHDVNSIINVAANKNLSGDFCGDRSPNKRHKHKTGTLNFDAGNSEFDGTVTDLNLITHAGVGTLRFTKAGTNSATKIQGANGSIFEFVNDYKFAGNIEQARTLNFENAEVAGNITDVNEINIAQDKTLMVGGTTIKANTIVFGNAKGTLALNSAENVTIESKQISKFGGNIDATKMADKRILTIIGDIGTDNTPLDKISLSGQNLNLQPGNGKSVNIAGIEFNEKASTIGLKTADASYALGELKKAKKVKVKISENISLLNTKTTGDDKLEEINFKADKTLTIGDIDITADSITTSNNNQGKIVFAKAGALKGNIGSYIRFFKTLEVMDSVEATTSGKAYVTNIALGDSSVLVVDNDYKVKNFAVKTDGSGVLRFTNKGAATFETATTVAPGGRVRTLAPVNAVAVLELQGDGNVTLEGNGLRFKKIAFSNASTLALSKDMKLSGIEVESTVADKSPTIRLASAINQDEIISGQNIGSDAHPVNLAFTADTILDVKSQKAFISVTTVAKEKGTVNYDLGKGVDGAIYGLGSENYNLKLVNLKSKVTNYGDTFANKVVVHDNVYYAAGGTVDGAIQLGHTETDAGGVASVEFRDNVILKADMTSVGTKNTIAFAGNAEISSKTFGTANKAFEAINFTGDNTHTATLKSSGLHAKNINFGNENIKIAASKVAIHGISQNNANIDLESNQLSLEKSGTWGEKTSIRTVLSKGGAFGNIVLKDKVTVASNVGVTVRISDEADVTEYNNKPFILIDGANHLDGGAFNLVGVEGVAHNRAYVDWDIITKDNKLMFERKVDIEGGITADLKKVGAVVSAENVKRLVKAKGFVNDLSFMSEDHAKGEEPEEYADLRAHAVRKVVSTTNNVESTSQVGKVGEMFGAALRNRMLKANAAAVSAGSDDTLMGAWAMPYYSQATQKKSGDDAGYGVKSFGGVVGFDTLVNDDLTIGAAVSFVKSDMKYKGDYAGKTEIGTFMGSIYAAQSLPQNFFVQAVASLGSSKIKGTDPRIVSTKTHSSGQETAKADYGTMSYGGEVLFGYNAKIADSALLTPMAGVRYTRFNDESYKETGTTNQNKIVGERGVNNIEAIVGAKVSTSIDTDGVVVTPELHAFVSQKLGANSLGKVDVRLEGMTDSFITKSEKAAKTSFNVGLGVIAKAGVMEYGAGYDANLAKNYVAHQGTLKVRVNF